MEDVDALRQCLGGDPQAFRHFVRRYEARALAHARVLTGNGADAADATQEAFFDAYRGLHTFDASREFYPWFYTLLRNRCLKLRSRKATRAESAPIPDLTAVTAAPEGALDLWRAIHRLTAADGELIVLKHLEGWTYEELSVRLDVPRGTVMSRLFGARRKLQAILSGEQS
jgi:RNA polymerase sigma-70 factor (ECF subfamily)